MSQFLINWFLTCETTVIFFVSFQNELKATGSTERKPSKLTLKTAAIAVCTAKRFSHMIEGPQREVACLSKTIVKDTFKEIEQLSDDI